ncbi:MAG TPA: ATP-binding cassette domain-containing protein [Thermoanaerobaculia bacterium]|nr:ATP-binding cassette domain-containing protein [Thermoanaerobaculia bacterium]
MPSSVQFRSVSVAPILYDINLRIAAGEAVAFVGRSGAGKTTTLRLVNGLARPTSGEVVIDDQPLATVDLIQLRRRTGYIIQGSGLFPHRTVYQNVALVPRLLGWPDEKTRAAAEELLAKLDLPLPRFGDRYPRSLSGGEQQRVGIARAMIARPAVLLCDEPFGALDPIVRRDLQDAFRALRSGVTILFVTHDLAEALRIAERIVLFEGGRVVADCPAAEFTSQPLPLVQRFVAAASLPS